VERRRRLKLFLHDARAKAAKDRNPKAEARKKAEVRKPESTRVVPFLRVLAFLGRLWAIFATDDPVRSWAG
jgi:hypothetical protein